MFGRKNLDLVVRMAPEEESGRYAIAEIGIVNHVNDEDYVTSAGLAFRRDHMSTDVRRTRDEARAKEKAESAKK